MTDLNANYPNPPASIIPPMSVTPDNAVKQTSLTTLVNKINHYATQGDDYFLIAAIAAAQLHQRLVNGEGGPAIKWMPWMRSRLKLSRTQIYHLIAIGSADDPRAALEEARRLDNERQRKRRKKIEEITEPDLSENHKLFMKAIAKLSDREAKDEYLAFWQRYQYRLQ